MAKKEKPADPLIGETLQAEPGQLPALSPPYFAQPFQNSGGAAMTLARGVKSIQFLDTQIDRLNDQKSAIYKQLRDQGYDTKSTKGSIRKLKADPIIRAQRERIEALYTAELEKALAALDAEDPSQADLSEPVAA